MSETGKYLNKKQACKYLGITNNTLDKWLIEYRIPYTHLGRIIRFDITDLDLFMQNHIKLPSK